MNGVGFEWPDSPPTHANIRLRAFEDRDVDMVMGLGTDDYVTTEGSLPAGADRTQACDYIARQRGRLTEGKGYAFCIVDRTTDVALGMIGLWLDGITHGRASVGYCVAPASRGHRVASQALRAVTDFAWTLRPLHRVEAYIEPWNTASIRTAEGAGFTYEGTLRSHQEIGDQRVDMRLYAVLRPLPDDAQPQEKA